MSDNSDFAIIDEMLNHAKHLDKVKEMVESEDLIGAYNTLEEMNESEECGVCSELINNLSEQIDKVISICQDSESQECASGIEEVQESVEDTRLLFNEAAELVVNGEG